MQLDDEGFIEQRRLADQRRLTVEPRLFGKASLGISMEPPMQDVPMFADTWEFPTIESALQALRTWEPTEQAEPDGWDRHPETGRYRIEGKRELEYIKSDGEPLAQASNALRVMQIEFAYIIYDEREKVGRSFPNDTRRFRVIAEDTDYTVFQYLDRCVVVSDEESESVSIGSIIRRLTMH